MQTVGESVKKLYSEIVGDLLPPGEKVSIELVSLCTVNIINSI